MPLLQFASEHLEPALKVITEAGDPLTLYTSAKDLVGVSAALLTDLNRRGIPSDKIEAEDTDQYWWVNAANGRALSQAIWQYRTEEQLRNRLVYEGKSITEDWEVTSDCQFQFDMVASQDQCKVVELVKEIVSGPVADEDIIRQQDLTIQFTIRENICVLFTRSNRPCIIDIFFRRPQPSVTIGVSSQTTKYAALTGVAVGGFGIFGGLSETLAGLVVDSSAVIQTLYSVGVPAIFVGAAFLYTRLDAPRKRDPMVVALASVVLTIGLTWAGSLYYMVVRNSQDIAVMKAVRDVENGHIVQTLDRINTTLGEIRRNSASETNVLEAIEALGSELDEVQKRLPQPNDSARALEYSAD